MRDPLLELIITLVERDPELQVPVTLTVGGLLVSGHVIAKDAFMQENWFTATIEEGVRQAAAELGEDPNADDGRRKFIHLRDVQYFAPGQPSPTPTRDTVTCRISLEQVAAFHFGFLSSVAEG